MRRVWTPRPWSSASVLCQGSEPAERDAGSRPDFGRRVAFDQADERPDDLPVVALPQSLGRQLADSVVAVGEAGPEGGIEVELEVVLGQLGELAQDVPPDLMEISGQASSNSSDSSDERSDSFNSLSTSGHRRLRQECSGIQ